MKNIWKIFTGDLKKLVKQPFALVIIIGLCVIPSLYAWFNIFANWDPYANTGGIPVAVVSLDQDYTLGLDSGAVGLAKNENYKAIVPEDIQKFIDETEQKVIDGEITVGTAFDMSTDEVAALRDSMKP